MKTKIVFFSLLLGWLTLNARPGEVYLGDGHDILLQGFTWQSSQWLKHWNGVSERIPLMTELGVTMLWLPPSADSVDSQGYLPRAWYNQNNAYGNDIELRMLLTRLKAANIKALADVVVNHRSGQASEFDFQNPYWADSCAVIVKEDNRCVSGNKDTGELYDAAPDLDHRRREVQQEIERYAAWLINDMGYAGFRWDFAKGFAPGYVRQYCVLPKPYFSVGEYWDGDTEKVKKWVQGTGGTSAAFDFPLKYALNHSLRWGDFSRLSDRGRLNGFAGSDSRRAVTFLENHATENCRGDANNTLQAGKELRGYALILTHPGIPCIFWGHYFDGTDADRQAIRALVKLRKDQGLNARSKLKIQKAAQDLYASITDNKVALRLGTKKWDPGKGWGEALKGEGYQVWVKEKK